MAGQVVGLKSGFVACLGESCRERAVGQFQVVRHRKRFFAMLNGTVGREIENPVIPPARVNA